MKLLKSGKTKDVYELGNGQLLLGFKDEGTVDEDGNFDPGGNKTGVTVKGMGEANLRLSSYFFEKIKAAGIPSHFISADFEKGTMTVKPASFFGKGLEHICRFKAAGSFIRRFGMYAQEGQDLPAIIEITVKDDERGDPLITAECLIALDIMTIQEHVELVSLTTQIANLVKDELAAKGTVLYDIKLEFGRSNGEIILIDEIAGGSMRVYKNGALMSPLEIAGLMLS